MAAGTAKRDAAAGSSMTVAVLFAGEARTLRSPVVFASQQACLLEPLRREHKIVDVVAVLSTHDNSSDVVGLLQGHRVQAVAFLDAATTYQQYQRWAVGLRLLRQLANAPHDWVIRVRPDHYFARPLPWRLPGLAKSSVHVQFRCLADDFAGSFTEEMVENGMYKQLQAICPESSGRQCACHKLPSCRPCEMRVGDQFAVIPARFQHAYLSAADTVEHCTACWACCVTQHLEHKGVPVTPIAAPVTIARTKPARFAFITGAHRLQLHGETLFTDNPTGANVTQHVRTCRGEHTERNGNLVERCKNASSRLAVVMYDDRGSP
jgi:hypothetical protein